MSRTLPAHNELRQALKRGGIEKPTHCERCKKKRTVHAHHEDYSKPLEVQWLCQSCHRKIHSIKQSKGVYDTMSTMTEATRRKKKLKLLSTNRVAEICEVSPRTVAKWIRDGELVGIKMYPSKNWRVEEAELVRFIKSRRVQP